MALSIDDFYLSKEHRKGLAKDVHPLFATRGVPGTHDVGLMNTTISRLLAKEVGVPLPKFNKHQDDCAPEQTWECNEQPIDIIILEGWCVGSEPQPLFSLSEPINALELKNDKEGVWRRWVLIAVTTNIKVYLVKLTTL
ncbi:hypothetical protein ACOBV9_20470 (plasmid) [Pseudoalteromonas espejiana]